MPKTPQRTGEARIAEATCWLVVMALLLQLVASLVTQPPDRLTETTEYLGIACGVAACAAFMVIHRWVLRSQRRHLPWAMLLLCLLVFAMLYMSGWSLVGLALAGLLLGLPGWTGIAAAGACTLAVIAIVDVGTPDPVVRVAIPIVAWLVALVLYTLTRLVVVLDELNLAREHLARVHVDEERHRISRDLHDVMGRTLVSASLRNELAIRMLGGDADAARMQLEQNQQILDSGQKQLRSIISGPVATNLEQELKLAKQLCDRLDIDCRINAEPVPDEASALASAVVREAITNLLKHSRPRSCWISCRLESTALVLAVVNDGCHTPPGRRLFAGTVGGPLEGSPTGTTGSGLASLGQRVARAGGTLATQATEVGRFVVTLRLPYGDGPATVVA